MSSARLIVACALGALCLPLAAQTPARAGLWEITQKTGGNPKMEQAMAQMQKQMAAMPPAQRKQMEDSMAKQGAQMPGVQAGALVNKVCLTKEMLEQNGSPGMQQQPQRADCKVTRQDRSASSMKVSYVCTAPPSSSDIEVTYQGQEAYQSRVTIKSERNGKTESMLIESAGKWLGADCGAVKPVALPAKK